MGAPGCAGGRSGAAGRPASGNAGSSRLQRQASRAQRGIERGTDVVEQDVVAILQQARRGEVGLPALSPARRWPTITRSQVPRGLGQRAAGRRGLEACTRPLRACRRQIAAARSCSTTRRSASASERCAVGVRVDVAVEVGAGQHHDQRAARRLLRPALRSNPPIGARAGRSSRRPALSFQTIANSHPIMIASASATIALRGLPVAIVGTGQRWRDDADRRAKHVASLYSKSAPGSRDPARSAAIRRAGPAELEAALTRGREHTAGLVRGLRASARAARLAHRPGPCLNLPLWELGHVGWFEEFWIARNSGRARGVACDPLRAPAPRRCCRMPMHCMTRRTFRMTTLAAAVARSLTPRARYLGAVRSATLELLRASEGQRRRPVLLQARALSRRHAPRGRAFHGAALGIDLGPAMTGSVASGRQRIGRLARPRRHAAHRHGRPRLCLRQRAGRAGCRAGRVHDRRAPVTWGRYMPFVEAGGYADPRHVDAAGWAGCQRTDAAAPLLSAAGRRRVAAAPFRAVGGGSIRRPGPAHDRARGRGLVPLGGAPLAHRGGMGVRCDA